MKFRYLNFFALTTLTLFLSTGIFAQSECEKGLAFYQKADYKNAVKTLKKATQENSADFESLYYLGLSYIKTGDSKAAAKVLQKAVEINKTSAEALTALSYSFLLRNDQIEAQNNAQKALEFNPKNAETHYILGVINLRNGSFNYAYERAKKALDLNPSLASAYYLKTEALINSFGMQSGTIIKQTENRYELLTEAAESLEKFLSLAPTDKNAGFLRAYLKSLQFFAQYYSNPENRKPINFDAEESQDKNATGLAITYKPKPQYTSDARNANVSGTVRILAVFGDNGEITNTLVIKTLGFGLDEEAVKAAKTIKFKPQIKNGKPVTTVKTIVFNFVIYDRIGI